MAQEYYIREMDQEEARGPFDMSKLVSLAEANQVHKDTLYYDEASSQWVAISANDKLRNEIFPERQKLSLKPKSAQEMTMLNEADEDDSAAVSVDELLAAAEGDTEETRHVKVEQRDSEASAKISPMLIGLILLIGAIVNVMPNYGVLNEVINGADPFTLLNAPMLIVGVLDAFFALAMFLAVTELFPLIRLRAALGLGFYGFLYWSRWTFGDEQAMMVMICSIVGSVGMYVCTITLNFRILLISAIAGLGGIGGMAYFLIFAELLGGGTGGEAANAAGAAGAGG